MSSISEKICVDCKISKPLDKFPKTGGACNPCVYIRRTKGKTKNCKICKETKPIPEFLPKSNLCKVCIEKEELENVKLCSECNISKPYDKFVTGSRVCNSCAWIKKADKKNKKTCRLCNESKVVSDFAKNSDLCKKCYEKENSGTNKTCKECNISKSADSFEPNRYTCRECRSNQKMGKKTKICKICNETKLQTKFKKGVDLCIDCSTSEKLANNKLCKICEDIKPISEFYGNSWVCKICSKEKFKEKMSEVRKCEGCNVEKENKFYRELSSKRCLECEDKSITRICTDCGETKSIADFNPKRHKCHECEKADGRNYRKTTTKAKEWVEKNPERMTELQKKYYEENKPEIRKTEYIRKKTDDDFRQVKNCKNNVATLIQGTHKSSKSLSITRDKYVIWLEYNFEEGMNLDNYGKKWCIDHVIPLGSLYKSSSQSCSGFVRKNPNHKKLLMCWYNTTPVTLKQNRLKSDKFDRDVLRNHIVNIKLFLKEKKNKKDPLYFEYKKFVTDILEFLFQ
jgi:hypothetical protein